MHWPEDLEKSQLSDEEVKKGHQPFKLGMVGNTRGAYMWSMSDRWHHLQTEQKAVTARLGDCRLPEFH